MAVSTFQWPSDINRNKILPMRLLASSLVILFLVRMSLTSLVMLVKAPDWMSEIRLLEMFTERSLGWLANTSGVRRSEIRKQCQFLFLQRSSKISGSVLSRFLWLMSYLRWGKEAPLTLFQTKNYLVIFQIFCQDPVPVWVVFNFLWKTDPSFIIIIIAFQNRFQPRRETRL